MSEKASSKQPRSPDPRATRTRNRLGDAVMALIQAKPLETITVQEVLDRAQVSRSTFYEHYQDKTDLLFSDVDEFFASMSTYLDRRNDTSARVAAVTEFFTHVGHVPDLYRALMGSENAPHLRELGEAHFARGIKERLVRVRGAAEMTPAVQNALSHALAGSLFGLLGWWMRQPDAPAPATMDRLFHRGMG